MQVEATDTILGNQIRVRLVKSTSTRTSKVVGFVHNPDTDPDILLDMTHALLEHIGADLDKRTPTGFRGDRWLVLANDNGLPHIETYQHVYSQLAIQADFTKNLMVLASGRIEALTG